MKRIIFILTLLLTLKVHANTIYNIDVNVYIEKNGDAEITETWDVKGSDGTEWYHPFRDLDSGHYKISNYTVLMDGIPLTYKQWNINETLNQKAGFYGINYTSTDTELCFGKKDFNRHTFTLKYNVSNFIFNTDDAQVMYWTFFPVFQKVDFKKYNLTIRSYFEFPESLDLWSFGHKSYYYSKYGVATFMNSEDSTMNGNYVVALAKFEPNTFNTTNRNSNFQTFKDVLSAGNEGTFEYDYGNKLTLWQKIWNFIKNFFWIIIMIPIMIISAIKGSKSGYGYKNNRTINKKEVPNFRDIPCNKDIYYANALLFLNNFDYKETNILGAIILKWVKKEKVQFIRQDTGIFKKETNCLDLRKKPTFEANEIEEEKLFNIMLEASKDGILEPREFGRWARANYSSFFDIFKRLKDDEITKLRRENHIYIRNNKEECKKLNVMDDTIYEDSTRLYGLKKFLQEFSNINTKETLEVHIWEEYLMFAYLFGIADKVAKQLKNLYPELLEQNQNMDYTTIMMINSFSSTTVSAASTARSNAEGYSGGGGGFGLGGGGFGAGGGGGFSGGGSR